MPTLNAPKQNHFLAALPPAEYARLLPYLQRIEMDYGRVLCASGSSQEYVYFPTTAIVSLLWYMQDGSARSNAVVGNEGVVGIALSLGGRTIPSRAVVQSAGHGYRLPASVLQIEFGRRSELQNLLLRFSQALVTQMAQTAVCHLQHSDEQQLCRWLLLSLDGLPVNGATMAQDVTHMPGERREAMNAAARALQARESLEYQSGRITVLNRRQLERQVCECYAIVREESERLLSRNASPLEAVA
jgi:hypothetical protein